MVSLIMVCPVGFASKKFVVAIGPAQLAPNTESVLDLLLRLKLEESDHRIRAVATLWFQPALRGNRWHTGGTFICLPRRAVARSMRPRRTLCRRRANHRRFATLCGSGTASH
jgi:hypothetical protein